jgi:hypothetical protein
LNVATERSITQAEARPLDALLAIALQLKARLDASDGIRRNLGNEAVLLRSFGYKNPEIAAIIGSTSASVAELISQAQKATTGRKTAKGKKRATKGK